MTQQNRIIVIGAGPAGMMAAIRAAQKGGVVILLEKNDSPGRKLLLTGGARCNFTNTCGLSEFISNFSNGGEFLRDAFKTFFNGDLMEFFRLRGIHVKIEPDGKVFPGTDKAKSVLDVLVKELEKSGVKIICAAHVKNIEIGRQEVKGVKLDDGKVFPCEKVILAAGGVSYPSTGSSGEGFRMAEKIGHHITPLRASLVPLDVEGNYPQLLEGLALEKIGLKIKEEGKKKGCFQGIGDIMFTKRGVSGPLVLSLSGKVSNILCRGGKASLEIDMFSEKSRDDLQHMLLKIFTEEGRRALKNILKDYLPERMAGVILKNSGISQDVNACRVTKAQRDKLILSLKGLTLQVKAARSIDEAMVTAGGVKLSEINPRTMESKLIKGLYFAGEIMDIDGNTGGFNLQAAFSTGYLAGESSRG